MTLIRTSRQHHDMWYQLLEDPYEMRVDRQSLFETFKYTLELALYPIARMKS